MESMRKEQVKKMAKEGRDERGGKSVREMGRETVTERHRGL